MVVNPTVRWQKYHWKQELKKEMCLRKLALNSCYVIGIGTFKIFVMKYNMDISLPLRYIYNVFNDTSCP